VPRTASRRTSRRIEPDTETDDYLDDTDDGGSRRGRRRDADPEEDTSRRRSRRSRFADEADPEDESDVDPEDEPDERAPRASRRSRGSDDDRPPRRSERTSRSSRREERSERPSGRDRGSRSSRTERGGRGERRGSQQSSAREGWSGYRQTASSVGSDFADNLKIVDNTDMLIKLMEAEPVAAYAEHWLTIDDKRRSFVCLGDGCPICDRLGDRPSVKVCMNVADMDANPPEVKMWTFGSQVGDMLEKFADNDKTSPLNRDDLYWTLTRTKKSDRYTTVVRPVKARDLVEDFDTDPLTAEELDELEGNLFERDQIFTVKTKAELNKMIEENDLDDAY
jgi:hypothetical protein